jgi:uncharacterized membrane protein
MKHLSKPFVALCILLSLFSCSKKVTTFQFGQPYHQNNSAKTETASEKLTQPETEDFSKLPVAEKTHSESPLQEKEALTTLLEPTKAEASETKPTEKPTFKQKMLKKAVAKIQKKQDKGGLSGLSKNMRIGILIAAIGLLILIMTAIIGFGGASGIFWFLGAVALLVGLIIILLELLK